MNCLISEFQKYFCLSSSIVLVGMATSVNAFQLDFTGTVTGNLTNDNSDNNGATLRYGSVATDGSTNLDLVVTALDTYTPVNAANNGLDQGGLNAGQINIARGTSNRLGFQFVVAGTDTPFTASSVEFDLYDIDSNGISREFVTLSSDSNYEVSNSGGLNITTTNQEVTFSPQALGEVPNLTNLSSPTSVQEDVSVSLLFSSVSSFELTFGDDAPAPLPFSAGRNVFFTSQFVFSDSTIAENFQAEVPFEFSPTLGLLLSGLGNLGLKRFRKQKMLNLKAY